MTLQKAWYQSAKDAPWWLCVLAPLRLLFAIVSGLRRRMFRVGLLSSYQAALPVVIVGNISVGGNGKTPFVLGLAAFLAGKGIKSAVLSRGYGGEQKHFPYLVKADDSARIVGDEPALMCQRLGVPVVLDPVRARGARFIKEHTDAQIILCDDGLQHYALKRDIELCVTDSRGLGNGMLLPQGPLRESKSRLNTVDWIIYNGADSKPQEVLLSSSTPLVNMHLRPACWINLSSGKKLAISDGIDAFAQAQDVTALAGIGSPKRFFDTLDTLGIKLSKTISFDDHHQFIADDIPSSDVVLMTEKDAVKCRAFAHEKCWYLQVDAILDDGFYEQLLKKLAIEN
ncbi:tetraacyldisaccharide 4'-kinase [Glaciecola siphonariae]|uniref:Tetraacyldisaccharide 4'-kinase n=1 Tax=Glaciecola siphonariae TaxID=521012 RepID=A0ABV9LRL7_9ALTE